MATEVGTPPQGAFLHTMFRRGLTLTVVLAVVGAALGFALGSLRAESAVAKATVLITPLDGNPFSPSGSGEDLTNLLTEAELVSSDAVARLAARQAGVRATPDEMLSGLSVSVPPNTQIIDIEYSAGSKETAVSRAQAFAEAFLDYRRNRAESLVSDRTDRVEAQIDRRSDELEQLLTQMQTAPNPSPERALLREQINSVSTQIGQLRTTLTELGSGSADPGQVVTPAAVPSQGLLDSRVLFTIGGLILGILAALVLAVLRSRRNSSVYDVDDIDAAGLPLLGEVLLGDVVASTTADRSEGEPVGSSYRDLRVALLTRFRKRPLSVLLAGAGDGPESPLTGWGMAEATARSKLETILVDASGGLPGTDLDDKPGLSEVLTGRSTLDDVLVPVDGHLRVLPAGVIDSDADDLFLSPAMSELLDELQKRADVVITVTGSIRGSRARALATMVDVVAVEAGEGVTTMRDLTQVSPRHLEPAEFGGVVFVEGPRRMRRLARSGRHARS